MKFIHILLAAAGLALAGCSNTMMRQFDAYGTPPAPAVEDDGYVYYDNLNQFEEEVTEVASSIPPAHQPKVVDWAGTDGKPGMVVIALESHHLYVVNIEGKTAIRFPIAVGKEGFKWTSEANIGRKEVNPTWTPPAEMVERKPELEKWAEGMPGGIPENPLGTRALYLYDDAGRDTLFRIHGTNVPESIGTDASSGCIRMYNQHVEWLYHKVEIGARVRVVNQLSEEQLAYLE
jgi:lipoprotein-anchoring transpeptidase ErfK/SrfK